MPGFDRTGPEGKGSQTGKKNGRCRTVKSELSDENNVNDFSLQQQFGKRLRRHLKKSQDSENDFERGKGVGKNKRRGRTL